MQNTNDFPLISIIIPVYNVKLYLNKCLDSILAQSYKSIEIILVDDGSTDGSSDICDEYRLSNENIIVIHQKNKGLSGARNAGINEAHGDYILFVDSDDIIFENSISKMAELCIENNLVEIVFLKMSKFYEEGVFIPLDDGFDRKEIKGKKKNEVLSFLASMKKYPASACSKLIKRPIVTDNKAYFEEGKTCEDLDWTVRILLLANNFDFCDSDYYCYRQNRKGSITQAISEKRFNDLFDFIRNWSNNDSSIEAIENKNNIRSFVAYELTMLLLMYGKLTRELQSKYKKEVKSYLWLLNYRSTKVIKMERISLKIVGIRATARLLNLYTKYFR